jgi:hypothetical protein
VKSGMLRWNESEDVVEVNSAEHLLELLDSISRSASPDKPIIATLHIHNHIVGIGLGFEHSFVHIESEERDPPYWITTGDLEEDGVIEFFFHGVHQTEISKSNLIERKKAREVISKFFQSGERPEDVSWVQV